MQKQTELYTALSLIGSGGLGMILPEVQAKIISSILLLVGTVGLWDYFFGWDYAFGIGKIHKTVKSSKALIVKTYGYFYKLENGKRKRIKIEDLKKFGYSGPNDSSIKQHGPKELFKYPNED